jgi:DNA polymerase
MSIYKTPPMNDADKTKFMAKIEEDIKTCTKCGLCSTRINAVPGYYPTNPFPKIVLVGEAPGEQEDISGEPFVGSAGQVLNLMLRDLNIDRHRLGVFNVVKCRPPFNRQPNKEEIVACHDFLMQQLYCLRPIVIVILGAVAANAILGQKVKITQDRGKIIIRKYNNDLTALFLTLHPSAILHNPKWKDLLYKDLAQIQKLKTLERLVDQHEPIKGDIPCLTTQTS